MLKKFAVTSSALLAGGVVAAGGGIAMPANAAEAAQQTTPQATPSYCVVLTTSTGSKQSCSATFDKALRDAGGKNVPDGFTYDQFTSQTRSIMSGATASSTGSATATTYWEGTGYDTTVAAGGGASFVFATESTTGCTNGSNIGIFPDPAFGDNTFDSWQNGLCNQAKMWDTFNSSNKCANGLQNSNGGFGVWQDLAAGNRNRTSCVTLGSA